MSGNKFDNGKPRMDLISPFALEGLAKVLTFGADKYGDNNWREGITLCRLYAAAQRHQNAWLRGETIDPESGLPHIHHAMTNLMMMAELSVTHPQLDDRYFKAVEYLAKPGTIVRKTLDNGQENPDYAKFMAEIYGGTKP